MKLAYGIKNFRVFDKNATRFNLKPITVLTGANCAGKSSLVKSILLLKTFLDKARENNSSLEKIALSFNDGEINISGIDSVYNNKSLDSKEVVFSVSRTFFSHEEEILAEFYFASRKEDFFNDGWLKRLRFSCILKGVSEEFLDVRYDDDGKMHIDTMNLSGNVYDLFCRNLDLATYDKLFEDNCISIDYGFFDKSAEECNVLCSQLDEIVKAISDNPINEAIDLSYHPKYMRVDRLKTPNISKDREIVSYKDVKGVDFPCWKKFKETGILMYLSVLDEIGGYSPDQLGQYFDRIEIQDELLDPFYLHYVNSGFLSSDYKSIFNRVLSLFRESGSQTFLEFYKCLQNDALLDVGAITPTITDEPPTSLRQDFLKDRFGASNDDSGFLTKVSEVISMLTHLHYMEYQSESLFREKADYYLAYRVLTYLERKKSQTGKVDFWTSIDTPHYMFEKNDFIMWRDPRWDALADIPESYVFDSYRSFLISTIKSLIGCEEFEKIRSVGSFLCPVLRTYSKYDQSNPMSRILMSYFYGRNKIAANKDLKYVPGSFIDKWVKDLGIGKCVSIVPNDDATGIHIFINDNKGNKLSSADFGHGVTQILFVLVNIEVEIMESLLDREHTRTLCFEEPEVSLHPSWQSKLAQIIRDANSSYGIHFIIETHSEYFTRATQAMVAKECKTDLSLKAFPCVVYYMEQDGTAYDLEYTLSGRFNNSFGPGFYDEASRSSLAILQREKQMRESETGA